MRKSNKNKKNEKQQESRLHTPQATSPVNLRSGDKLRENPSNDEETISQDPRKTGTEGSSQSPLSREHDGGRSPVTNEDNQKEVVNPSGGDWDEPKQEPSLQKNPYEEIEDDPNETQKKIPKM